MKKVNVFYHGWGEDWQLGTLADNGKQLLFEFSDEALKQGLELSPLKIKLQKEAFGDLPSFQMKLPGFIADSLPDGWGLLLMDKFFRKKGLDPRSLSPLDRLIFIGNRGMGALRFEPSTEEDPQQSRSFNLQELAEEAQLIYCDKSTSEAVLKEMAMLGGSPHGARPKVLLNFDPKTNSLYAPEIASGTPCLFKFPASQEHKEVCAIEYLYSKLADICGLEIPKTHYFDLDKNLAAFGIERFDREESLRVPIHTLAGALHADFRLSASVDYSTFLRMTRKMTQDEREVFKAFERCIFNVLFNNRDDHAKNFSYRLNKKREWKLAPAYDLTYNEGPGGEHQMDLFGAGKNISHDHLLRLAKENGLDAKKVKETLEEMMESSLLLPQLIADFPVRKATTRTIIAAVERNRSKLTSTFF